MCDLLTYYLSPFCLYLATKKRGIYCLHKNGICNLDLHFPDHFTNVLKELSDLDLETVDRRELCDLNADCCTSRAGTKSAEIFNKPGRIRYQTQATTIVNLRHNATKKGAHKRFQYIFNLKAFR